MHISMTAVIMCDTCSGLHLRLGIITNLSHDDDDDDDICVMCHVLHAGRCIAVGTAWHDLLRISSQHTSCPRVQGDSVFIHVRDREILNRGRAGLHFFDCPFQFGNAPEHTTGTDTAEDADITTFDVRLGDIIIVATDGIWDNMQDADMLEFLPTSSSGLHKVQGLSRP